MGRKIQVTGGRGAATTKAGPDARNRRNAIFVDIYLIYRIYYRSIDRAGNIGKQQFVVREHI